MSLPFRGMSCPYPRGPVPIQPKPGQASLMLGEQRAPKAATGRRRRPGTSRRDITRLQRRVWDLNPRTPCEVSGFQDRCTRPLCEPSRPPPSLRQQPERIIQHVAVPVQAATYNGPCGGLTDRARGRRRRTAASGPSRRTALTPSSDTPLTSGNTGQLCSSESRTTWRSRTLDEPARPGGESAWTPWSSTSDRR